MGLPSQTVVYVHMYTPPAFSLSIYHRNHPCDAQRDKVIGFPSAVIVLTKSPDLKILSSERAASTVKMSEMAKMSFLYLCF